MDTACKDGVGYIQMFYLVGVVVMEINVPVSVMSSIQSIMALRRAVYILFSFCIEWKSFQRMR